MTRSWLISTTQAFKDFVVKKIFFLKKDSLKGNVWENGSVSGNRCYLLLKNYIYLKSYLQQCASNLSIPLISCASFFLLSLFRPNSNTISSSMTDGSNRNIIWTFGLEIHSPRQVVMSPMKHWLCSFTSAFLQLGVHKDHFPLSCSSTNLCSPAWRNILICNDVCTAFVNFMMLLCVHDKSSKQMHKLKTDLTVTMVLLSTQFLYLVWWGILWNAFKTIWTYFFHVFDTSLYRSEDVFLTSGNLIH